VGPRELDVRRDLPHGICRFDRGKGTSNKDGPLAHAHRCPMQVFNYRSREGLTNNYIAHTTRYMAMQLTDSPVSQTGPFNLK